MRSAVNEIVRFNRGLLHRPSLKIKLARLSSSPFGFFRGTFHLFAEDILEGPFRKWPTLAAGGQIIGDLHTENFGTFRATSGGIVYDINDFDETTKALYEYDVRRLATSLILASLDNMHSLGIGAVAAEQCVHGYLAALARDAKLHSRTAFEKLKERHDVREVLASAGERSRVDMMKRLAVESQAGKFAFDYKENYLPVTDVEREDTLKALPRFLKNVLAPKGARPERFTFQDVAFRVAGCGSLGRLRYALLLGNGKGRETYDTLRLIEWKDSLDSALDVRKPRQSKNRNRDVVKATIGFQIEPKCHLGVTTWAGRPMQAREIGANDCRFQHSEFTDVDRFRHAARIFGEITARAHLVSTIGKRGPRQILKELAGPKEDRWVKRMVAFAVAYADRTLDDYVEFIKRKEEVAKAWN